jgi:RimJ/RimL family protein N-acetyltransferase
MEFNMYLRKLLLKDSKSLQQLFLKEKNLKDTGANVNHEKITLNYVRNLLKERIKMYKIEKPSFMVYAITIGKDKLIGTIGIDNINYKKSSCEIGYWISEKYIGKGYGTLAIKLFLIKISNIFDLKEIVANVSKNNIASCRILEKNGFKIKRELKNNLFFKKS